MSSRFVAPASVNAAATRTTVAPVFWRCECSHPIYDHGRLGKDGNQVWVGCRRCGCSTYRASDGSAWPNSHRGAVPPEPTDLDVSTEHWIDGDVYLSTDEPPL